MTNYLALSARISKELQELERVVTRAEDIWRQSESGGDGHSWLAPGHPLRHDPNALDRYRGFRHVVRNIYSFDLDRDEMASLLRDLRSVFAATKVDLTRFAEALKQISTD